MWRLRLFPDDTRIRFMRQRYMAYGFTVLLTVATLVSLSLQGLNLGSDFTGGIVIDARAPHDIDIGDIRGKVDRLGFPQAQIQQFGAPNEVLIRVKPDGEAKDLKNTAVSAIQHALGPDFEFRKTDFVGPQVSKELLRDGILASVLAVLVIAVYVWFRFEWQFGVSALVTTFHDVLATVGLFSLTRMTFDLTVVAAILTIAGYSINDTVVVFDRIRENRRMYKKMNLSSLIDLSVNQTLTRTVLTAGTTLLSALALLIFGGQVLFGFAAAMTFGILIGTYSSIFVASALMLHMPTYMLADHADEPTAPTPPNPPAPPTKGGVPAV